MANGLRDTYVPANVTFNQWAYPIIIVEGLEIEGDYDGGTALSIRRARNVEVRNCKIHGSRYTGLHPIQKQQSWAACCWENHNHQENKK